MNMLKARRSEMSGKREVTISLLGTTLVNKSILTLRYLKVRVTANSKLPTPRKCNNAELF